jgi:hypothetical protein
MKWLVCSFLTHALALAWLLIMPSGGTYLATPAPKVTATQEPFDEIDREQVAHVARQIAQSLQSSGKERGGESGQTAQSKAGQFLKDLETERGTGDVPHNYELARHAHQVLLDFLSTNDGKTNPQADDHDRAPREKIESYEELERQVRATAGDKAFPEQLRRRVEAALRAMLADACAAEPRPPIKAKLALRSQPVLSPEERATQAAHYAKMMSDALGKKAVDLSAWMSGRCEGSPSLTIGGHPEGTTRETLNGERQPHIPLTANVPVWVDAPVINPREALKVPGRRFSANGKPAGPWVFPESWYVIGPFPNRSRAMIRAKFPPEETIDLDAVYLGDKGREVRWEFWKSESFAIRMPELNPYEIYYAWTEVYFDRATDCWLALGSDDHTKVWINDYLVFQSSDQLKVAHPDEAFRKVHFKEGYNRVLVRLENAIYGGAFIFLIHNE